MSVLHRWDERECVCPAGSAVCTQKSNKSLDEQSSSCPHIHSWATGVGGAEVSCLWLCRRWGGSAWCWVSGDVSSKPISFCSFRETRWFFSDLLFLPLAFSRQRIGRTAPPLQTGAVRMLLVTEKRGVFLRIKSILQ